MTGQCRLCLQHTNLKKSHFLPAGAYKRLREKNEKNPNPWRLSNKTLVKISKQKAAHLLCTDCEQLFSKYGENWVLGHCLQEDGNFPLASILASRTPDVSFPNGSERIYYASNVPEINIPALAYFAASIFWRGSVYAWNDDGSIPVRLGPFQEQFQQYLMGLKAFPQDCSLVVFVREGKEINHLTHTPISERKADFHIHKFSMLGLAFTLAVSKNIPAFYCKLCFLHDSGNPVLLTKVIDKLLEDFTFKRLKPHLVDRFVSA